MTMLADVHIYDKGERVGFAPISDDACRWFARNGHRREGVTWRSIESGGAQAMAMELAAHGFSMRRIENISA
jgi:hypothetical protein